MNYGQSQAVMVLAGERMGLKMESVSIARTLLEGGNLTDAKQSIAYEGVQSPLRELPPRHQFDEKEMNQFHVVRYCDGRFDGVMAGCGRNKGTWDSAHSKSSAYRHAKALRIEQPGFEFRVEPQFG